MAVTGSAAITAKASNLQEQKDAIINDKENRSAESSPKHAPKPPRSQDEVADEITMEVSKICFVIGQTTQLVCSLISRFQQTGKMI